MDIQKLVSQLDVISADAAKDPYYIRGEWRGSADSMAVYTDEGMDFCQHCATAIAGLLARVVEAGEDEADGPIVCETGFLENDTCRHCHWCGDLLEYSLTECGVGQELEHFTEHPPAALLSQCDAYHLARLFEADAAPDDAAAVVALAEKVAALLQLVS